MVLHAPGTPIRILEIVTEAPVEPAEVGYYAPFPDNSSVNSVNDTTKSGSKNLQGESPKSHDSQPKPFVLVSQRAACVLRLEDIKEAD
ncbi:hypothetical protein FRB96_000698 [Tulasnella sp. 330]|nr:hypothetical protein FRB96_000698 [Tulasnella sp. 330]